MFFKWTLVTATPFLLSCVCASVFVNTIEKCSYKDEKCVADMLHNILQEIGKNGIKDLNMPPIEPMKFKNVKFPLVGLFDMTLNDEQVNGIKDCIIQKLHIDLDKGATKLDLNCDIKISATFTLDNLSPLIVQFMGEGSRVITGNANVKIDNLDIKLHVFHNVIKKDDGDVYFKLNMKKFVIDFEINSLQIKINKLLLGQKDLSEFMESFLNQNWRSMLLTYGVGIFDVTKNVSRNTIRDVVERIPAKDFYTDDFSSFIEN